MKNKILKFLIFLLLLPFIISFYNCEEVEVFGQYLPLEEGLYWLYTHDLDGHRDSILKEMKIIGKTLVENKEYYLVKNLIHYPIGDTLLVRNENNSYYYVYYPLLKKEYLLFSFVDDQIRQIPLLYWTNPISFAEINRISKDLTSVIFDLYYPNGRWIVLHEEITFIKGKGIINVKMESDLHNEYLLIKTNVY